jgi:two-component system sensor histidine kinase DesK
VREAVTNVQRHARASHVRVQVGLTATEVQLTVTDNGNGMMVIPGNGLHGMRERLLILGGRLEIESVRGKGTRILAALARPPGEPQLLPRATAT